MNCFGKRWSRSSHRPLPSFPTSNPSLALQGCLIHATQHSVVTFAQALVYPLIFLPSHHKSCPGTHRGNHAGGSSQLRPTPTPHRPQISPSERVNPQPPTPPTKHTGCPTIHMGELAGLPTRNGTKDQNDCKTGAHQFVSHLTLLQFAPPTCFLQLVAYVR